MNASVSELFGESDPRNMPPHFFGEALWIYFDTALAADASKQNYSTCPRYWYVDARLRCRRCEKKFTFAAEEQRNWYEVLGFYVDSWPRRCQECRRALREEKRLRQEYDRDIATALRGHDLALKERLAEIVDTLCEAGVELPEGIHENRRTLGKQIDRLRRIP